MTKRKESYEVLIPYREPTYEMRRPEGPRDRPFVSEITVRAASEEAAVEAAVQVFEQRARDSSVFWVREIDRDGIRVQRVDSTP